ncbi:MAG: hypothetical protein ACN2B6_11495, partial [Rickettsiales bacterium]
VKEWEWDKLLEDDPCKGEFARDINNDLCAVLRHISKLDKKPRADSDHGVYAYNLADIQLWVAIYRRDKAGTYRVDSSQKVNAVKHIIKELVDRGRYDEAAFTACNPSHTKHGEVYMSHKKLGNVGLTELEEMEINNYCISLGFDPKQQRIDWDKRNYKRVMEDFEKATFR